MSEESTAPETGGEGVTTEKDEQAATKPTETVDFWKAKAREQEKRAKENVDAAKRLADIEEAHKSETQKSAEALHVAESRAETAESKLLRYEVMDELEVPANARRLVHGSTREEIESSCKDVLELIGDAGKPRTPKPNPAQREGDSPVEDKDALAKAFFGLK